MDNDIKKHITTALEAKWEAEAAQLRASATLVVDDLLAEYSRVVDELADLRRTILRLSSRYGRCVEVPAIPDGPGFSWEREPPSSPEALGRALEQVFGITPPGYHIDELADGWCARWQFGGHLGRFPAHRDARIDAWTDLARREPEWARLLLEKVDGE